MGEVELAVYCESEHPDSITESPRLCDLGHDLVDEDQHNGVALVLLL